MASVSVIVSFYNKINYLRMILAALERQSFSSFEVIIADDGSRPEVVSEIEALAETSALSIRHVWHEDRGFRKTRILNRAVVASAADYLVFMDGDCIPHHRFVEEHWKSRTPRTVLAGRRANVSPRLARLFSEESIRRGLLERGFAWRLIWDGMTGKSNHVIKGIYVGNGLLQRFLNRRAKGVLGSNFSLFKADLLRVNGFDERYEAPAVGEDTDLEVRLAWDNVAVKMVKNRAVQYHLDHPKLRRSEENMKIFETVLRERISFTPYGINRGV